MPPKNAEKILFHFLDEQRSTVAMAATDEQYRIRFTMKADGEDAEVMVYSEISSDKWWGDETTQGDFDKALKEAIKNGARNLNIRINSPGGEVYAAVAMRSMVINAGFEHVRVMIEGLCASAATLFATIPGAHVVIAEGSEFMIHNPVTITWGNASEIEKTVEHLHKMEEQFQGMYAAKTGKTEDQIKAWMDETHWFTAKEACDEGFCDELLASEKIAACVTSRDMALMKSIYAVVPEEIQTREHPLAAALEVAEGIDLAALAAPDSATPNDVSNGTPVAGVPTENISNKEENPMELDNLTMDQLRDGNPALLDEIQQNAVAAERARIADIDALTDPGYEELAEQAKASGTSAMDFHKQIIAAKKQKGNDFMQARQTETAPAAQVAGGTPTDNQKTEEQEIADNAKDIADYAMKMGNRSVDGMF